MELIRLAAFVMNSEVAVCHSEILPALKDILRHLAPESIDCIDYVTGVIQAPGHSVLRANTFSMGSCWAWQQAENGQLFTLQV